MNMPIVFLIGSLLVWDTGMYMFDVNWPYDCPENQLPIQIKHVHSSVSYQQVTHQQYDRHVHESPSGCGASGTAGRTLLP